MARKTYISRKSIPHFSVGERRIAFQPSTQGNSFFTTGDTELQKRIEAHPWYRKKFVIYSVEDDDNDDTAQENVSKAAGVELTDKHFATLADAKSYLASEFGAVRSNIRTQEQAIETGRSNGINIIFDR